ncbi:MULTISPECIES: DsbA family protein [Rhodococcus]|uniref:DsbA family protein n=1 Tax=Rhodococcus TaxID=1827 RepID=UPI0006BA647A|nr:MULTISPECIES: thioredoxin domain-containing protein [Rhodococcus]KPH20696.1 disulfide bond formation protein [Rhodococcus sp. ADH]QXC46818.1 DsbA family protein [Rhodococcus qingshengii]
MTSTSHSTRRRDIWLLGIAILVAAGLVGVLVVGTSDSDEPGAATGTGASVTPKMGPLGDLANRVADDPMALGDVDAPVVMVAFSDFRCPFCAQFSRVTEPQLIDRYVDTGTLRIEWRDLPIFGQQSFDAARAGRAAAAQDKFWEFTRAVYADAPDTGHADLTPEALQTYARQAGVPDLARFTADATGTEFDVAITADSNEAKSLGIPATPAFSVNGVPVLGAQPLSEFVDLIDTAAGT